MEAFRRERLSVIGAFPTGTSRADLAHAVRVHARVRVDDAEVEEGSLLARVGVDLLHQTHQLLQRRVRPARAQRVQHRIVHAHVMSLRRSPGVDLKLVGRSVAACVLTYQVMSGGVAEHSQQKRTCLKSNEMLRTKG